MRFVPQQPQQPQQQQQYQQQHQQQCIHRQQNAFIQQQMRTNDPQQLLLPQPQHNNVQNNRHSDPLGGLSKEKLPNFSDLSKAPPFKDYLNNLHTYQYLQQLEAEAMQPRHTQITQQYSSSTDEGCDTDHGGKHKD